LESGAPHFRPFLRSELHLLAAHSGKKNLESFSGVQFVKKSRLEKRPQCLQAKGSNTDRGAAAGE